MASGVERFQSVSSSVSSYTSHIFYILLSYISSYISHLIFISDICPADDCDEAELEDISNGWRTVYRRLQYRGAVHRYHCHKSFSLLGSELAWCDEGGWRHGGGGTDQGRL